MIASLGKVIRISIWILKWRKLMEKIITGLITAANIAAMGKTHYGFLGIETDEHEKLKIKVTAFTKYDTLDVGKRVTIELQSVGNEALLAAKRISLIA